MQPQMLQPPEIKAKKKIVCCGNPKNQDASMHPFVLVGENNYGDDVFVCPECGAVDYD